MAVNKKDLAPLSFPKVGPEKIVREYLYSKATKSLTKKFPEWDMPRMEPSTELVAKKRELYDVEQRLVDKRREANKKRKEMNAQWRDLEDRETILRENFIKFNKFVKENQEKRERAERKLSDEKALIQKRSDDITELKKNYDHMLSIKLQMERNIKNHRMYEEYLQNVVKACSTFRTVDDILDRYETLAEARKVLAERQEEDLSALEDARNEMIRVTEEKTLHIMGLNNVMAELQSRYEAAKSKALQWELMVTKIKDTCVDKLRELYEVRRSCWNVYLQMCKRKEIVPELAQDDIENQLLFIKRTLLELKRITKISRRRATREGTRPNMRSTRTRRFF
ncbi:hypothetical protein ILUMI_24730 [Ignelater luminosus]|uniref:DUF4200 domain-containing protein n=1 Tax=Ignelater luminosus TaxID=2038154 RepID=A0A8K0G0P9_IGNLU|nr:hypothetical protein ILUMI_24730 [Ignelater luminosus]